MNELTALATVYEVGIGNILMPGGIPGGYPYPNGIPDDQMSLEDVERDLAMLKKLLSAGDDRVAEHRMALEAAAQHHRRAQITYDAASSELEAMRSRYTVLLGLRDDLLARKGG